MIKDFFWSSFKQNYQNHRSSNLYCTKTVTDPHSFNLMELILSLQPPQQSPPKESAPRPSRHNHNPQSALDCLSPCITTWKPNITNITPTMVTGVSTSLTTTASGSTSASADETIDRSSSASSRQSWWASASSVSPSLNSPFTAPRLRWLSMSPWWLQHHRHRHHHHRHHHRFSACT